MKAQVESPNSGGNSSAGNNGLGLRGQDGRVHKSTATKPRKEEENEEIKLYLAKLQELVPFMPKHKKLSKLEVIQYVIDYIRDLRTTLGMPPSVVPTSRIPSLLLSNNNNSSKQSGAATPISNINHHLMDYVTDLNATSAAANNNNNSDSLSNSLSSSSPSSTTNHLHVHHHTAARQPLCVISTPNNTLGTTGTTNNNNCSTQELQVQQQNHHQIPHPHHHLHHQLMDKSPSSDIDTRPVSC